MIHRALGLKLKKLREQKRRDREQLVSKTEKLERTQDELEAAEKTTARLDVGVETYKTSPGTKRYTAERENTIGSGESLKLNGSPEIKASSRRRRKRK